MVTIRDGASIKTKHDYTLVRVNAGPGSKVVIVAVDLKAGTQVPRRARYAPMDSYWELEEMGPIGILTDEAVAKLKKFSTVDVGSLKLTIVM